MHLSPALRHWPEPFALALTPPSAMSETKHARAHVWTDSEAHLDLREVVLVQRDLRGWTCIRLSILDKS